MFLPKASVSPVTEIKYVTADNLDMREQPGIAAALAWAGVGGLTGGIIGALIGWDVPEERAKL